MIYSLSKDRNIDVNLIGTKAKYLMDSKSVGLHVPDGIVLSVDFFLPWVEKIYKISSLQTLNKEDCDKFKKIINNFKLSDSQRKQLYKKLTFFNKDELFAIRSSFVEEDMKDLSFAGMFDTYLGIKYEEIEKYIKLVFASNFDYRVMSYRKKNDLKLDNINIAIIIQKQLKSDISGIGFSINPENNCYDEVYINSSYGLGTAVVEGVITPDNYIVNKIDNRIIMKDINTQEFAYQLNDEGKIQKIKESNFNSSSLSIKKINELSNLMIKCEELFDFFVDIEWAYENNKLYLLQVRPVTSYFPIFDELLTNPKERKKLYVDALLTSQGFSDQMSVLGLDIWQLAMEKISREGIMPSGDDGYLLYLNGKQYFHVSNILKGMGGSLGISTIGNHDLTLKERKKEIVKEYKASKRTKKMNKSLIAMIKTAFKVLPIMIKSRFNPDKYTKKYKIIIDEAILKIKELEYSDDCNLLVEDIFDSLDDIYLYSVVNTVGELAMNKIKKIFKTYDVNQEISNIRSNLKSNPTTEMTGKLVQIASDSEIIETNSYEEFKKKIDNKYYSDELREKLDNYMYLYGDRTLIEIDIKTPRPRNNLEVFYNQIKFINVEDNQFNKAKKKKEKAYKKLLQLSKDIGKEKKFTKNFKLYENLFGFRETPKYLTVVLIGRLREFALEIGVEFVKQGRLKNKDQIFNLQLKEISLAQKNKNINLFELMDKNLKNYKQYEKINYWPINFDSRGKLIKSNKKLDKNGLKGIAISSGVVKGKAKVINKPFEKEINQGDIIVMRSAEPSCTPMFINAAGVVLEVGGLLQHGAIITREFGIPCVSGISDVTQVINDGDIIEVDGDNGIIKIKK